MSEGKPPKPDDNRATGKLSLADLITQTPGAQPREQLIERINARQQKRPKNQSNPTPSEEDLTKPEPMNIIDDPDGAASDIIQRIRANAKAIRNAKQKEDLKAQPKPPKGSKLTLVRKDGKPVPPDNQ
jgi:hypothetical protein